MVSPMMGGLPLSYYLAHPSLGQLVCFVGPLAWYWPGKPLPLHCCLRILSADCCIPPCRISSCLLPHSLAMFSSAPSPPDSKASLPSGSLAKFIMSRHPDVMPDESLPSDNRLAASITLTLKSLLTPASSVEPGQSAKAMPSVDTPCVSLRSGLGLRAGCRSIVVGY